MIAPLTAYNAAIMPANPMQPYWAEIVDIVPEAPGVSTYWIRFEDQYLREHYSFKPGQFNMLGFPGLGEAAISISSDVDARGTIGHTVRYAGNVTSAISRLSVGDFVSIRGPFGTYWPMKQCLGQDVYIAAGGIGLPPLRPVIYEIMKHRDEYGKVVVIYGARTPRDLQFVGEYEQWKASGIEMVVTVDRGMVENGGGAADPEWTGPIGVVPIMFYQLRMNAHKSIVLTCGPEIMIRFVIFEALARRIPASRIFVSMERNMKCGLGQCGHCQLGPFFICKDGPVFSFQELEPYFNVEDL